LEALLNKIINEANARLFISAAVHAGDEKATTPAYRATELQAPQGVEDRRTDE
jgi:hypothetical protein